MNKSKNNSMDRPRDAHGRFESAEQAKNQNNTQKNQNKSSGGRGSKSRGSDK